MSLAFGRQKRLLLGVLALLVAVPLPFNDVVEWPVAFAYFAGVALFLRRAQLDPPRWLPLWGMNVLGLVYLPLFIFDLLVLSRDRLVLPVVHLGLFALLVKLFALTRERDKWQAALGIFFLFLAAMGTSVHPTIVLYLLAFLVAGLVLLVRFAFLHVLAGFGRGEPAGQRTDELARPPLAGFLVGAAVATVALAVPLFALLPRVRNPYIVGRAGGTGTVIEAAGFSDDVTLDSIGKIRDGQGVAMRILGTAEVLGSEPRFKAATYDLYLGGRWRRSPLGEALPRSRGVRFRLSEEPVVDWVRIFLQPLRSRSLPLPIQAAVVEPRVASLDADMGGAVSLGFSPVEVVEYRVGVAARPVMTGEVPGSDPAFEPTLDTGGVSPRMSELARRVMGGGTAAERAGRLENHLVQNYGYTRDFEGRTSDDPLDDFLFKYRTGQCEYFASSMVLLLRSQGIPARLVTGFLGGEYNPFEGYTIVRDGNAHAWVEAYLGPVGWRTFDPTPPSGRQAEGGEGTWPLLRQAWDYVLFRWDRYVLTFGLYDQIRILGSLRHLWHDFWRLFATADAGVPQPGSPTAVAPPVAMPPPAVEARRLGREKTLLLGALLLLFALVAWRLVLRYRPPLTATGAYRRLRRLFSRPGGVALPASAPPLAFRREAERRYPRAAEPAATIVELYLRESFGGEEMADGEREILKAALEEAERGMRKAG